MRKYVLSIGGDEDNISDQVFKRVSFLLTDLKALNLFNKLMYR